MEAGGFNNIRIESRYPIKTVKDIIIEKEINNHGTATVLVALEDEGASRIVETIKENDIVKIVQEGKEEPIVLFSGVVEEVTLIHEHEKYSMELKLISNTIKLDYEKKSRSFQNKENPYKNLFDLIVKQEHGGDFIDEESKGAKQNRTIIQYEETDWEFLKRLASQLGTFLVAETKAETSRLWIGLPVTTVKEIKIEGEIYTYKKVEDYQSYTKNGGSNMDLDYVGYRVESYEQYELCNEILINGQVLVIAKIRSYMKKQLLIHEYSLESKNGLKKLTKYNEKLTGVSIVGEVLKVEGDKVKVRLEIDKEQKESEANWYQVSTMYASEGSTGFYFMPEVGASVNLYIPTSDEDSGFIRGVARTDGSSNPKTTKPVAKYMGNTTGKELKMDGKELTLTAKEGQMFVSLNVEDGITIQSDESINMQSSSDINFYGNKINISAEEKIVLETEDCDLVMDNVTHFRGSKIIQKSTNKE